MRAAPKIVFLLCSIFVQSSVGQDDEFFVPDGFVDLDEFPAGSADDGWNPFGDTGPNDGIIDLDNPNLDINGNRKLGKHFRSVNSWSDTVRQYLEEKQKNSLHELTTSERSELLMKYLEPELGPAEDWQPEENSDESEPAAGGLRPTLGGNSRVDAWQGEYDEQFWRLVYESHNEGQLFTDQRYRPKFGNNLPPNGGKPQSWVQKLDEIELEQDTFSLDDLESSEEAGETEEDIEFIRDLFNGELDTKKYTSPRKPLFTTTPFTPTGDPVQDCCLQGGVSSGCLPYCVTKYSSELVLQLKHSIKCSDQATVWQCATADVDSTECCADMPIMCQEFCHPHAGARLDGLPDAVAKICDPHFGKISKCLQQAQQEDENGLFQRSTNDDEYTTTGSTMIVETSTGKTRLLDQLVPTEPTMKSTKLEYKSTPLPNGGFGMPSASLDSFYSPEKRELAGIPPPVQYSGPNTIRPASSGQFVRPTVRPQNREDSADRLTPENFQLNWVSFMSALETVNRSS